MLRAPAPAKEKPGAWAGLVGGLVVLLMGRAMCCLPRADQVRGRAGAGLGRYGRCAAGQVLVLVLF